MKKLLHVVACLALAMGIWACEQPKAPDFKLNHEIEAPLTVEKTYPFLGRSEALIDTTSNDYADLFSPDANGLVRITKEEDFNLGDLSDAIPEVDVPPASVNTQVGEISLTNFKSGSGTVGSASFEDVTGFPLYPQGQTVPAGSTPGIHNISLNTDYFESAVIKEDGMLEMTLTNDLGLDLDQLNITLLSGSETVSSTTITNFSDDATETVSIDIPADISATNPLENLSADVSAGWSQQPKKEGDTFTIKTVSGQNLVASQVTAAVESQSFTDFGTFSVDQSNFEFRSADDFVELGSGELAININSGLNIGVETLDITFTDIVDGSGQPLTLPSISVPANGTYANTVDLSGYRIKAENGTVNYTINAQTENTQDNSNKVTINETDEVTAEVNLNNLQISRAEGYVVPKMVLLNEDQTGDGNLNIFNDDEAEIISINGIANLSDRVSDLSFENPILRTVYNTNLGINTTVYAVIAGTDAKGNTEYLTGTGGSELEVQDSEIPAELEVNGQEATASQVVKFPLETADNPDPQQGERGENVFDASNTNASAFFSNLPTDIRFVGTAMVNARQQSGTIVNPVIFDPKLNLDLPLNFSADGATFKDTLEADLSDLPDEESDRSINEATLTLNYTNALPLDLDLVITMLDESGQEVTHKGGIAIQGAGVDSNGYVSDPAENNVQVSFEEDELMDLYRTRDMKLDVTINTPEQQAVSIKADDSITLQIELKADITSTVN